MLILSRRVDESITLPGLGELRVVELRGDNVRLGFDFPEPVRIFRNEVWAAVSDRDPDKWRNYTQACREFLLALEDRYHELAQTPGSAEVA